MPLFLLHTLIFTGSFYLLYRFLFRPFSFLRFNRWLLLAMPVIAVALPLIGPFFSNPLPASAPLSTFTLPEIALTGASESLSTTGSSFNWLLLLYLLGFSFFLIRAVNGIFKGLKLLKTARQEENNFYFSRECNSPFTFLGFIILPESLRGKPELKNILKHEQVHAKEQHGIDNIFYLLLNTVFWFNPFTHLLGRELRQVHEGIADQAAADNRQEYAQLIVNSALGGHFSPLAAANPFFNSSLIKIRIRMLYQKKTPNRKKWLYLALMPVIAAMMLFSCSKTSQKSPEENKPQSMTKVYEVPLFPGCDEDSSPRQRMQCFQQKIQEHVQQNFKYPAKAQKLRMEGRVYVDLLINEKGKITDVEVKRGLTGKTPAEKEAAEQANDQAVTLIKDLPQPKPAIQAGGQPVSVRYTIPISLQLPQEKS